MNSQEVLNKVYLAVRAQGVPSRCLGECLYRGPDGLKCAAGHLIDDQHYKPVMEGHTATYTITFEALKASGVSDEDIRHLVSDLQRLHDGTLREGLDIGPSDYVHDFVAYWDREVAALAARYGLTLPQVPA